MALFKPYSKQQQDSESSNKDQNIWEGLGYIKTWLWEHKNIIFSLSENFKLELL